MTKSQRKLVEFAIKHPGKWHSYYDNRETVEIVCATHNLGIIKVNEFGQFRLKSEEAARRFLQPNH